MTKNQFLNELRKKFKNAISREKKMDLFDFTSFFAWTFFKVSGSLCAGLCIYVMFAFTYVRHNYLDN